MLQFLEDTIRVILRSDLLQLLEILRPVAVDDVLLMGCKCHTEILEKLALLVREGLCSRGQSIDGIFGSCIVAVLWPFAGEHPP